MNKKIVMVFVAVLLFAVCFCLVYIGSETPEPVAVRYEASGEDISEKVSSLFIAPKRKKIEEKVYVGGYPVGLSFEGEGAFIIGLSDVITENGVKTPRSRQGFRLVTKLSSLTGL